MPRSFRTCFAFFLLLLASTWGTRAWAQTSIADARSQGNGATVTVEGTVTRALGDFVRLQDASGPTGASALVVRQTSGSFHAAIGDGTIRPGTRLRVTGTLSSFNALLQINEDDLSSYDVQGTASVPTPQDVTLSDLAADGEDYESELVRVTGLSVQGASGTFGADRTYQIVAGATGTTFDFRVQSSDESALGGTTIPRGAFDYTGVVGQFDPQGGTTSGYQLIPIRPSDLSPSRSFSFSRLYALAEEGTGTASVDVRAFNLAAGDAVTVTA
ncbi:MAG: DNA-binding protein, partial [Bacteroidetes bacterium]|nr:DNA-binding protein [Bacteroidota bacterium]